MQPVVAPTVEEISERPLTGAPGSSAPDPDMTGSGMVMSQVAPASGHGDQWAIVTTSGGVNTPLPVIAGSSTQPPQSGLRFGPTPPGGQARRRGRISWAFGVLSSKICKNPTAAVSNGHSDYGRDGDDPPALAHPQIGRVEPRIGPVAGQRAVEEVVDPLIYVSEKLGCRLFEMPLSPVACARSSTLRVETPPLRSPGRASTGRPADPPHPE